jgi:hypothetical protein
VIWSNCQSENKKGLIYHGDLKKKKHQFHCSVYDNIDITLPRVTIILPLITFINAS